MKEQIINILERDKETYIKIRNKNSKSWQYDKFYYYQGQIDYIDKLIKWIKECM